MTAPAPAPSALIFDEAAHTYTVEGVVLPSVTQVLQDVGVIDYGFIPREERERYLQRGRAVHLATELDDAGELEEESVVPAIAGFLAAWRRFRSESGFVPELIEYRSYNPSLGYAGTLDRSGKIGQSLYLLDIKTGHSPWWVAIQLAAYCYFFNRPLLYRRIAVEVHDDGTYKVSEFQSSKTRQDFDVFTAALMVSRAKERHAVS